MSLNDRFVDRDMFMRYLWGLAVGHIYTHEKTADIIASETGMPLPSLAADPGRPTANSDLADVPPTYDSESDTEDPQLGFDNFEDDDWEEEDEEDDLDIQNLSDDEMAVAMDDMYGPSDTYSSY
jgi:hypothetical protein